ncbi:MAG: MFS transporter [Chloroflexi bacterium]|nr:MAG: MFS transporter [Chloroflexota bacterium]TMF40492.1 MAG: MFS transporter [Chloroflexota bacterium]
MTDAGAKRDSSRDESYGWVVVGALSVTVTVSYGVLTYAFGVLLVPMERDLGWSRIELTGAFSLALAVWAVAGVAVGIALDRFSPRVIMAGGSLLGTVLVLAWAEVQTPAQLYIVFAGIGVAMAAVQYNAVFAVATKWFRSRRRTALTAITLVGAFSSFIFSPLTGTLTAELGWRQALVVLAVVLGAITIPLHAGVLRRAPHAAAGAAERVTADVRHLVTSAPFWFLAVALALGSYVWSVMVVQLVPFLVDSGHSLTFGALAAGVVGLGQLPGRLVYVFSGERLGGVRLPATTFGFSMSALTLLAVNRSEPAVLVFAAVFGMSSGMLTLMSASLPADLFGRHAYGTVSGVIYAFSNGARAIAPFASAATVLLPGGYTTLLGSLIGLSVLAALLGFLALGGRAAPSG